MLYGDFLKHEYDFIVIGGGTAGLCVAARATEVPNFHVGVLEAGPAHLNDPMIMIPGMYLKAIGDSKYDWKHMTVPQVYYDIPLNPPHWRALTEDVRKMPTISSEHGLGENTLVVRAPSITKCMFVATPQITTTGPN